MRPLTGLVLAALVVLLGGAAVFALGGAPAQGDLSEQWVSETPRDNQRNHHAIGVGPENTVVAPVTAVPGQEPLAADACSMVRLAPGDGGTLWTTSIPSEDCYSHGLTQPAIADIDGDGDREVIGMTTANDTTLSAYDAVDGSELFGVPMPAVAGYGQPVVVNLTAAPGPEIVAVDMGGNAVAVDGNGTVLWRQSLEATTYTDPVVADVDGDGAVEIAVGTRAETVVLSASGDVEGRVEVAAKTLAAADVDDDAAVELFVTSAGVVTALDGADLRSEWEASVSGIPRVHAVGGDGGRTLYVGVSGQRVLALDAADGDRRWETQVGSGDSMMPAPAVGDLSGDGSEEVVVVTNGGTVAVLDPESGGELAAYERDVLVWTFPTLADIDGDGAEEILVRYGDGRVVALEYAP